MFFEALSKLKNNQLKNNKHLIDKKKGIGMIKPILNKIVNLQQLKLYKELVMIVFES